MFIYSVDSWFEFVMKSFKDHIEHAQLLGEQNAVIRLKRVLELITSKKKGEDHGITQITPTQYCG